MLYRFVAGETCLADTEIILGEIPVVMKLNVGSERLSLFLTKNRILVARVGKRAVGSEASFPAFAALSGPIEALFKWRRESSKKKNVESLSPEGILAADKDNFPIPYQQVVSVEIEKTEFTTRIMLLTTQDKMSFTTPLGFEKVLRLFREQVGEAKLRVKRTA